MQVQYYGLIKQSTGEDWEKASIALSTAQPSIGGSAPHLPTRIIRFKRPPPPRIAQLVCACVVTYMKQLAWFLTRQPEEGFNSGQVPMEVAETTSNLSRWLCEIMWLLYCILGQSPYYIIL